MKIFKIIFLMVLSLVVFSAGAEENHPAFEMKVYSTPWDQTFNQSDFEDKLLAQLQADPDSIQQFRFEGKMVFSIPSTAISSLFKWIETTGGSEIEKSGIVLQNLEVVPLGLQFELKTYDRVKSNAQGIFAPNGIDDLVVLQPNSEMDFVSCHEQCILIRLAM